MFLAINEIRQAKLRYGLVAGVIFLVAFLVFFLTGLSYGLAQQNRTAVDRWNADGVLLSKDADNLLNLSVVEQSEINRVDVAEKAYLAQLSAIVSKGQSTEDKAKISFFAIDPTSFLKPKISEGKLFSKEGEVVADETLAKQYGYQLGDTLTISGTAKTVTIVGFTKKAQFNVAPVIYLTMKDFEEIRYGSVLPEGQSKINAIAYRGEIKSYDKEKLTKVEVKDFINALPGYSAQVKTFLFMIGSLIVIAAVVIGIFIYVLTMQKQAIFGVMKAQGISNQFIGRSITVQTFLLAATGTLFGLAVSVGMSFVLPAAVPYQNNAFFLVGTAALMIVSAVISAIFSVRTIVKIDPIRAIG